MTTIKSKFPYATFPDSIRWTVLMLISACTLFSCSKSDTENREIEAIGMASVNVKIIDASFDAVNSIKNKASSARSITNDSVQESKISLNNEYDLITRISTVAPSTNTTLNGNSASNGQRKKAEIVKGIMATGVRYKIVVYDNAENYVTEKDYIYGSNADPILLDGGKDYIFITYSINSKSELPQVSFSDQNNKTLKTSSVSAKGDVAFLYAKQIKKLIGGISNDVNVALKYKFCEITVSVDASVTGYSITQINSVINHHQPDASISLSEGNITRSGVAIGTDINFPTLNAKKVESAPTIMNADISNGTYTIRSIKFGEYTGSNIVAFDNVIIKPGQKYKLEAIISLKDQDKYTVYAGQKAVVINKQIWMQHNLGANTSLDPNQIPYISGLHGSYYQWGSNVAVANGTDLKPNNFWNDPSKIPVNRSWNAGTELKPIKTAYDPCPRGYRVPTKTEFNALIANTTKEPIGTIQNNTQIYSKSFVMTSKVNKAIKIVFPLQGRLGVEDTNSWIFTSVEGRGTNLRVHTTSNEIFYGNYVAKISPDAAARQFHGLNVRCIAE